MQLRYEIPDQFWGLFRSVNREIYIDALLNISEEYQYNNYFLSREACIQVLNDMNLKKRILLFQEEDETELDLMENPASRILNWLLKAGWLKRIEDYNTMVTNVIIPDYSAVFIEAFERLEEDGPDDTEIYIQNVYATLFSFQNDPRMNISMLKTALVNTRRLNKALQDLLHNMDKFFSRLLEQNSYEDLLREHLEGYVEEIVRKKYHILKTSDNFYIYKMDIKKCLREMRENEEWIEMVRIKTDTNGNSEDILDLLDRIERGFDDIEHRIVNMDKEHSKYVRATVTRLNYLLNGEMDTKGLIVQLLNKMAASDHYEEMLEETKKKMNLSLIEVISEKSLYKQRKTRHEFIRQVAQDEEEIEDLGREDILKMNRLQSRYSKKQIEDFIEEHMELEMMDTSKICLRSEEDFEKLILAYDYSTRKNSKYMVLEGEENMLEDGTYRYPALKFVRTRSVG